MMLETIIEKIHQDEQFQSQVQTNLLFNDTTTHWPKKKILFRKLMNTWQVPVFDDITYKLIRPYLLNFTIKIICAQETRHP